MARLKNVYTLYVTTRHSVPLRVQVQSDVSYTTFRPVWIYHRPGGKQNILNCSYHRRVLLVGYHHQLCSLCLVAHLTNNEVSINIVRRFNTLHLEEFSTTEIPPSAQERTNSITYYTKRVKAMVILKMSNIYIYFLERPTYYIQANEPTTMPFCLIATYWTGG